MLDARFVRENIDAVRAAMADRHSNWDFASFLGARLGATRRRGSSAG